MTTMFYFPLRHICVLVFGLSIPCICRMRTVIFRKVYQMQHYLSAADFIQSIVGLACNVVFDCRVLYTCYSGCKLPTAADWLSYESVVQLVCLLSPCSYIRCWEESRLFGLPVTRQKLIPLRMWSSFSSRRSAVELRLEGHPRLTWPGLFVHRSSSCSVLVTFSGVSNGLSELEIASQAQQAHISLGLQ